MDLRRFAEAYSPLPEKIPPSNAERRELLDAPRKWMRFFDETMDDYLSDELNPIEDAFIEQLRTYSAWNYRSLRSSVKRMHAIEDGATQHNNAMNEFTFHHLNGPMAPLWHRALFSDGNPFRTQYLTDIQLNLAVHAAPTMRQLVRLQSNPATIETQPHKQAKGLLSEVDTAVTGIEIMKTHPELVILPAPVRYENNPHAIDRNVDLLLIDTEKQQVRGLQVKTDTYEGAGRGRLYNPDYVSIIDGANELGNSTFTPGNNARRLSLPGQIAMGILAEQPLKQSPAYMNRSEYMQARQIAKEIMKTRRSYLGHAVLNLSGRLLHDLYRQPSDTQFDEAPQEKSA